MNRDKFIEFGLEALMKDGEVRRHFESAQRPEDKEKLRAYLRKSLENSYDVGAKGYFESKGASSYISTFLRWTGAAADAIGTYMFWAMGGAGFGFKGLGLLEKTIADYIDNKHYEEWKKTDSKGDAAVEQYLRKYISKDGLAIVGEGLLERIAAYLPLGVGELTDLIRGTKKYDSKVISRILYHARESFLESIKDYQPATEPRVIPLTRFKNPYYSPLENVVALRAA